MLLKAEPKKLCTLDGKQLLIQVSIAHKHLDNFWFPRNTRILERDSIYSREKRKSKEGRDAIELLSKSVPTKFKFTVPHGYVLDSPVFQVREKLNYTNEISVYGMIRFCLRQTQFVKDKTKRQTLDFLRLLLTHTWDMRAYQNNLSSEEETFYSINIENLKPAMTKVERTLRFQSDNLLLTN